VKLTSDEYVIPNRATARTEAQRVYEHARCAERRVSPPTPAEGRKALLDMIANLTDATLRKLGLRRLEKGER